MSQWKIIIEDLAQLDLQEIYDWYETGKAGLGDEFVDAFEEAIAKIERNPLHASLYDETYRSASLNRFPYAIIFIVATTENEVYVVAITHLHRKPSWFKQRR